VIIDVIDAQTSQLVWRGYDTGTLNAGKPAQTLDAAVDRVVSRPVHDEKKHAFLSVAPVVRCPDRRP
jgi:hypothetical protein